MRIRMIDHDVSDNATTAKLTEVAPFVVPDGSHIIAQAGENVRRSWGCVKTTSTLVIKTRTFAVVHVGLAHKYGGGQQWHYFQRKVGEPIQKLTAAKLSPRRRKQILKAYREGKAPSWAKQPFVEKPKKNGKPERHTRYKKVAICNGGELRSIYDGSAYDIGKTRREAVQADHNGGFYVYQSPEAADRATAFPSDSVFDELSETVILKCEVWGRCEYYGEMVWDEDTFKEVPTENTKEAWTYLKPIEVVQ